MDTFMDKLAQKLTAQEMIQANAAADAEELRRIEEQVQRYDECLEEMRKVNASMKENAEHIAASTSETVSRVDNNTKEAIVRVNETTSEALTKVNETVNNALSRMQNYSSSSMERMNDTAMEALSKVEQTLAGGLEKLEKVEIPTDGITQLVEEALQQIRESKLEVQDTHAAVAEKFQEQNDLLVDYVHKENVKVYRNVQAVVVDETGKQTEAIKAECEKLAARIKSVGRTGKAALVFSVIILLGVVAQLLFTLGIL